MISDWTYVDNIHIRLISSREPTAASRLPPLQTKAYSTTAYNSKVKTRSVNNILGGGQIGTGRDTYFDDRNSETCRDTYRI